ncbi:autoinducer binding domain-containing protein [Oricola sp.]|uniref:autoinducer binding domain-containing protein n=1 Tax=Oricola sp. TaxID=1979950 RepID=UPI0025E5A208|nr:autoinducer binding domain-containing protein [Oricola sp.]MCI5073410.1 autoinducer binding domain-containing protein [Oricola sp.]
MNDILLGLIDKLALPLGEDATRRALRDFTGNAGFDYYAYVHLCGKESFAVSNYPREWQNRYVEDGYLQIDPVVTKAKHGPPIFTWSAKEAKCMGRREVSRMFSAAEDFGIRSGLSISVPVGFRNRMIFTLATSSADPYVRDDIDPVTAAVSVAFVHARLSNANQDVSLATDIRLSPREAECLRWFAEGMTMPDIALNVGVSYRSVRSYLDEATRKLGAANNRQAASTAIRLGLI